MYSDLMDFLDDPRTGKAIPIYWCEKHKKVCTNNICSDYISCDFDDLEE